MNYSDTQSFMPKIFSTTPQPPTRISASLTNSLDWKKKEPLLMSGRESNFYLFKYIKDYLPMLLSIPFFSTQEFEYPLLYVLKCSRDIENDETIIVFRFNEE